MKKILATAAVAVTALGVMSFGVAPQAHAATPRNGTCEAGEFCYYYNSNHAGSVSDFTGSLGEYGTNPATCYTFKGAGNGKGLCIRNNASSVWNRTSVPVTVYYSPNYAGASVTVQPGGKINLASNLKNNDASHKFGTAPAPKPTTPTTPPKPTTPPVVSVNNPHPGANAGNGGWTPRAAWMRDTIKAKFGVYCNTYKTNDRRSEHFAGNGLDCWGTKAQRDVVAEWVKDNARSLEMAYVIHYQRIWSVPKASQGWRPMEDRGTDSRNHKDHIHISMQHPSKEY